jgi:hypothetical protein
MSRGLRGGNNGEQDFELRDTIQRTGVEQLDGIPGHLCEERNQSNEHEQSGKSCESNKCTCDPGTNATCTCTGATPISRTASTRSAKHTSFPCAHCRDNDSSTNGLVRKHKYTSISTNRECNTVTDYIERDYADYINATSAKGQGVSTGVRGSVESGNIKQADAEPGNSVERRIGIPAGVTI